MRESAPRSVDQLDQVDHRSSATSSQTSAASSANRYGSFRDLSAQPIIR